MSDEHPRVLVVGTSGAGKTTLARRIAEAWDIPRVELDAINWGPGWTGLSRADPEEFVRRVEAAVAPDRWVADGNYRVAQPAVLRRATDVIWLDYPRTLIMRRVLARSFARAASGAELWPGTGNRESWRRWLDKEHPIRWAWDTHASNRARYEVLFASPARAGLRVHRMRSPKEAADLVSRLSVVL